MRRAFLALCLVLFAVTAAAQVPPQPEPSGVAIESTVSAIDVSVEEPSQFQVTVTHTGGLQGELSQFGQARHFRVTASGHPAGWTVQITPADFDLVPGASQTVDIQVGLTTGVEQDEATLTLLAQLAPDGTSQLPPGPFSDAPAEASVQVEASRTEGVTRGILETLNGPWIYVVFLALLTAVILTTKFAIDRRRMTVTLHCDQGQVVIGPGGRAAFRMLVENTSKTDDTIVFHVSDVDDGWAAFLPVPELHLKADHVEELQLMIIAPKDARSGDRQSVLVTAAGSQAPNKPASINVEAVIGPTQ